MSGWANEIPNPFVLGGYGTSGRIEIYDAASRLVGVIDQNGMQVIAEPSGTSITLDPDGINGNPSIDFTTSFGPVGEFGAIYALGGWSPESWTGLEMSSTEYTSTITGNPVRQVCRVGADFSAMYVIRTGPNTGDGGYLSIHDDKATIAALQSNVAGASIDTFYDGYVEINAVNGVEIYQSVNVAPPSASSSPQIFFNEGYTIYADNTGTGAANSRFWLDMSNGSDVIIGPRSGGSFINALRLRTNATTASAANCYIDSSSQQIRRSTSSRRYKTDIGPVRYGIDLAHNLQAVQFRDRFEKEAWGEQASWHVGLIAEDVDAFGYREFVQYDQDTGQPDGVQYDRLTVALLSVISDLDKRLERLENAD